MKKYSTLTGTIYHNSKIPLKTWFAAMYLLSSHKKGISSIQMGKDLGISQKWAWFMMHRIREAMRDKDPGKASGIAECDETFLGGKAKNRHKTRVERNGKPAGSRSYIDKTVVWGIVEREGKLITKVLPNKELSTLQECVYEYLELGSILVTDYAYKEKGNDQTMANFCKHVPVKHLLDDKGKGYYVVDGIYHTNHIENFWSTFKRGIIGIYQYVSPKHTQRYCDEFTYRYNNRKVTERDKFHLTLIQSTKTTLSYNSLTGRETPLEKLSPEKLFKAAREVKDELLSIDWLEDIDPDSVPPFE